MNEIDIRVLLAGSFTMGLASAYLAYRKKRNPYFWFFIGLLFGCFGIFAIFFEPGFSKKTAATNSEPEFYIRGPKEHLWWYLDESRNQNGPISLDALTNCWKNGTISPKTLVWHQNLTEWKPLQELICLRKITSPEE